MGAQATGDAVTTPGEDFLRALRDALADAPVDVVEAAIVAIRQEDPTRVSMRVRGVYSDAAARFLSE